MPDPDLSSSLAALRPPSPTEAARSRALFRATLAHAAAPKAAIPEQPVAAAASAPRRLPLLTLAIPALALLLLVPLFFPPASRPASRSAAAPAALKLLSELAQLFPGQLDAVIERNGTLQLELAATPAPTTPPPDQALLLELTRGSQKLRVLAYSGRSVRLRLGREELLLSPLLTGSGDILLAGQDFAWTLAVAERPRALAGWNVTARPLVVL